MGKADFKYFFAYLGPFLVYLGIYMGGLYTYAGLAFAFMFVPLVEWILPVRAANDVPQISGRSVHSFFDWLLYLNLPIVYGMVIFYLFAIVESNVSSFDVLGMTLSVGIFIGASGINVAHELGHRTSILDQWLAKLLLLPALYQHFYIEHNRGHHRYVATPDDPATARYGETIYHFWWRSTWRGLTSAWHLEVQRLKKSQIGVLTLSNQMIQFGAMQIAYLGCLTLFFGWQGLLGAIAVAVIGFIMLESINYIEHYGLLRQVNDLGGYEKVSMKHSWNSNHDMGRILLYELTRHADHHYKASTKYQLLQHIDESPQLPTGYPGCIVLAMVPPLWFKVMNRRVPAHMLQL
ncbi:MAG: alkane 1-monooxygenase [Saprospiraceae bacterium]|nr:alkane 1-monooxygenase [Saprospiraceae bacterium]